MTNQYAHDGLRVKLNEINAGVRATEQRLKVPASERDTIVAAPRIMGGETNEGAVTLGIASGAFSRTILEVPRDTEEPLCVRNVTPRLSDQLEGELRDRTTYWRVRADLPLH